jgi:L-2-hydroxyglutarate oxidase LhgO
MALPLAIFSSLIDYPQRGTGQEGGRPLNVDIQSVVIGAGVVGLPAPFIPRAHFCKGSHFSFSGRAPFRHLVYPAPESAGLGVHMTLDLGGQARFGPAADFLISGFAEHGVPGLVNLFGIESPGLTSCLALAERVVARLNDR